MAVTEILRERVLRGVNAGSLERGQRLPSARQLVAEFDVDYRVILAAYRRLADDGLVEIRNRGGVYVAGGGVGQGPSDVPEKWFVDILADAFAREIPARELHEWLRRATETLRLRAVVISGGEDPGAALVRQLNDDFGLQAEGITSDDLTDLDAPQAFRRADVILATSGQEELAHRLGARLRKPVLCLQLRLDFSAGDWALLLKQPVWAIVATEELAVDLRQSFANVRGAENLRVLVHGTDDLDAIPEGAPTYITPSVANHLGETPMRGRILPEPRTISSQSARAIFEFVVSANMAALRGARQAPDGGGPAK
ncbi:MAG: GntR family transcriptional regulator [Gemmatimonadaceae bacterium]